MATLSHPAVMSHVTEILEVAHSILRRTGNHDLVQKVMILEGYLEPTMTSFRRPSMI